MYECTSLFHSLNVINMLLKTINVHGIQLDISDTGLIFRDNKLLTQTKVTQGYVIIQFKLGVKYKRLLVHRLIATAFIPNPENLATVNHINGIKDDNRVENLEWLSLSDNLKHAHRTGLIQDSNRGEVNGNSKLTKEQVTAIYISNETFKKLSQRYSCSIATIHCIKNKTRWQHLTYNM